MSDPKNIDGKEALGWAALLAVLLFMMAFMGGK